MAKRGRPAFKATAALRRRVQELVACGMSQDDVARAIGCTTPTLQKHFAEELQTGAAKKRAEALGLLWKSARSGNVAAQKKLEELTKVAAAEAAFDSLRDPAPAKAPKLGKKEQAAEEAKGAGGPGSEWGDDLRPPGTSVN